MPYWRNSRSEQEIQSLVCSDQEVDPKGSWCELVPGTNPVRKGALSRVHNNETLLFVEDQEVNIEILLNRLWAACSKLPNLGGDLWSRGVRKIHEKYGVEVYLNGFKLAGWREGEVPETEVTIQVEEWK
jgi:hypothetical protein